MYDLARLDTSLKILNSEICIVGSGIAALTAARRLLAAGHEVLILESGGLDHDEDVANLNDGTLVGRDYYPLRDARLRFFGGTSAIWGRRCAELSPVDLKLRPWVAHSGWPIEWSELERYYEEARTAFELTPWRPIAADLAEAGVALPAFDPDRLEMPLWSFDPRQDRFSLKRCRDIVDHPRCRVVTHATVTDVRPYWNGRSIDGVLARSLNGRRLLVRAQVVLLAAGGIENARLLLASRSINERGLGNEHDLVGRFFMEHPHARGGRIDSGAAWPLLRLFGKRHDLDGDEVAALISLTERVQAQHKVLNSSLTIAARQPEHDRQFLAMRAYSHAKHRLAPSRRNRALWLKAKGAVTSLQKIVDPLRPWLLHKMGKVELALSVRAEQAPNPNSRVMLDDHLDAFGMPRAKLDWRLSEIDKRSVRVLVEMIGSEFRRLGMGEVTPARWLEDEDMLWHSDDRISAHPIGGYHHMGTTRMAHDPQNGVVDGYGRVHGIDNLYIAGSSIFPTSGWANPTLTIAALALRTADRIAARQQRAQASVPGTSAIADGLRPSPAPVPVVTGVGLRD